MSALFKPGDRVQVRVDITTGHHRTPEFVQGKTGSIEAVHGLFGNPDHDTKAQTRQHLYLVSFDQTDLWKQYETPNDRLFIDIFEHWLEPN